MENGKCVKNKNKNIIIESNNKIFIKEVKL
jgi:hypothetical protein